MLPRDLKSEHFAGYPPEARKVAANYLGTLQQLPLSFLPGLLREVIDYDFKFPAERSAREKELAKLSTLSSVELKEWFHAFADISVSTQLEAFDWVRAPAQFVEQLSAHLWTTHQLDAFRKASNEYADRLSAAVPPESPPMRRLGISIIGQGVAAYDEPLFRKLRSHGAAFTQVKSENGLSVLLEAVAARAKQHPTAFGHWYIDGGTPVDCSDGITCVSYKGLESARTALLRKIQTQLDRPGMGPESLRTFLAQLRPVDLGLATGSNQKPGDEVLQRFEIRLLTEGSGTQIFSTVFAQWAAREALRRAQPLTLLVRFAPRQRQKPMNELLTSVSTNLELDILGSLVDADMAAYYNWLNQQRLPGAEQASFLVWFEGHNQALAIGPSLPRGTESSSPADLGQLLEWAA